MSVAPAGSVDEVLALFARWGADPYDEELSQVDHALQTAALARTAGASDALVAAALLHDVGHLLDLAAGGRSPRGGAPPESDLRHEAVGARFLSRLFPPAVTGPIALHVQAKRYRCATDPSYAAALSPGSRRSLELQGGPFDPEDARRFAALPGFADACALRGWDDGGKVEGLEVGTLADHRPTLDSLALG